jgi:hypothetical protein
MTVLVTTLVIITTLNMMEQIQYKLWNRIPDLDLNWISDLIGCIR